MHCYEFIVVCVFKCARAGLETAAFMSSGQQVDMMLLDIRMPGKTGVEVMREAALQAKYPVYAMTGHVDAEALEEFK